MKRTATFGSLFLSVFTLALWAQAPPQMPKPGPEHQRLHYFVGDWETITEAKPSPFGPGGKITAKDHNVMLGDFFVVFHSDSTGPMGQQKTVAVMGYDPKEKVYTYDGFTTSGERNKPMPIHCDASHPAMHAVARCIGALLIDRVSISGPSDLPSLPLLSRE